MRTVGGAAGDGEIAALEGKLGAAGLHRAQAGSIQDMDLIADALYGRVNQS
jgi:hypothetical protein